MITKAQKQEIKSYGLWRAMREADEMRIVWERRTGEELNLHNAHVVQRLQGFYYTCAAAVQQSEEKLALC